MKRLLTVITLLAAIILGLSLGIWWNRESASSKGHYCNNILRQIETAKEQAAQTLGLARGSQISVEQITPYLFGNQMPRCPSGGEYTLNRLGQDATCSLGKESPPYWHKLAE